MWSHDASIERDVVLKLSSRWAGDHIRAVGRPDSTPA